MMTDQELSDHILSISKVYRGDFSHLSTAIGAAYVAHVYGHRVLRIVTTPTVYRRHEEKLGFKFKDRFPEQTEFSHRSLGYSIAIKLDKFWEIVQNRFSVPTKEKTLFCD